MNNSLSALSALQTLLMHNGDALRERARSKPQHKGRIRLRGHIRETSPGRWAIVLDIHDAATGNRKREWHSFVGTKCEAQNECSRLTLDFILNHPK